MSLALKLSELARWVDGDIVRGAATVILAMGDGKKSAQAIDSYLRGVWPPVIEGAEPEAEAAAAG